MMPLAQRPGQRTRKPEIAIGDSVPNTVEFSGDYYDLSA